MRIFTAAALAFSLLGLTACTKPWKDYAYPAWGFRVSFRTPPEVIDIPAAKDGSPHTFKVKAVQGERNLVVEVTDASIADKTPDQLLAEIPREMIQSSGGTVVAHANVTNNGVVGRDVTIDRGAQPMERAQVFVADHRVYQVITQTSNGADDKEVADFLASFHLTGK
jgi:hypothetical protein